MIKLFSLKDKQKEGGGTAAGGARGAAGGRRQTAAQLRITKGKQHLFGQVSMDR